MGLAFVTGASGFLGHATVSRLAADGWRVVAVSCHPPPVPPLPENVSWAFSVIGLDSFASIIEQFGAPDLVIHTAGGASVAQSWQHPDTDFQRTVTTTAVILEALRRKAPQAILVYPSSAAIYGEVKPKPIPIDELTRPISPYGIHKLLAEELCLGASRIHGIRCCVVRFFSIYGPGLRKQLLWDILCRLARKPERLTLSGTGREARDFLYVDDAVELMLLGAEAAAATGSLVINGGTGRHTSIQTLAELLMRSAEADCPLEFNGVCRPGDPEVLVADPSTASAIGFQPRVLLDKGVPSYVEWFRDQNAFIG